MLPASVRLVEGTFPDYQKVIPEARRASLGLGRDEAPDAASVSILSASVRAE